MRPDDGDDLLTLSDHLEQTSAATVSRVLREALEIKFDALEEFEDGALVEHPPWFIRYQLEPQDA